MPLRYSSSPSSSSSSDGDSSLNKYLSQLRDDGQITAEESQSISTVLSNSFAQNDAAIPIINESIDAYVSINKHRAETGKEQIGHPGPYVRSIVAKKMEMIEKNKPTSHSEIASTKTGEQGATSVLQPSFIQNNDIGPNEFNENCLLVLSRCHISDAEYALKAYIAQKKRRELNGTEKIADPSNYVMAVLR